MIAVKTRILFLRAGKVSRHFLLKLGLLVLRYLPNTEVCNTCSRSELLILCVDSVIGISAWYDFPMLFVECLHPSVENL